MLFNVGCGSTGGYSNANEGYSPFIYNNSQSTSNYKTKKKNNYNTPLFQPLTSQNNITDNNIGVINSNKYDPNSLSNPYGAGSKYKPNGLMNPYSPYGSKYSDKSWTNPYATNAPKLYDADGNYRGKLSSNKYDPDSTSNPYGRYGSKYSPDSINNPYGAGSPYNTKPIYVVPQP